MKLTEAQQKVVSIMEMLCMADVTFRIIEDVDGRARIVFKLVIDVEPDGNIGAYCHSIEYDEHGNQIH